MSLSSFLSIARSALLAQQRAMDVTGHNVANAQTPGYSRQRLTTTAAEPLWSAWGTIGRGVSTGSITRVRDVLLDSNYRRESGSLGTATTLNSFLSQVEGALGEPSETGVAAALDDLFKGFGDLANDPANGATRDIVRQSATRLTQLLHSLDARIVQAQSDAVERLRADVDQVNSLAGRIAALNAQILAAGGPDHAAPDLQDQRDVMVDELSGLVGVRVVTHEDGTVGVIAGDTLLVDAGMAQTLVVRQTGSGYGVGLASTTGVIDPQSGSLKALTDLASSVLPGLRGQLDTFVASLVGEVNAVHRTGFTLAGVDGVDFFDATKLTAGSLSLSTEVQASSDAIAASATGAAGDGGIALLLAGLGTRAVGALGGRTLREFYTQVAQAVGSGVSNSLVDAETAQTLVDSADAQRTSVSGVSLDEEMVALIAQQQAYGAAARLVNVADEMMQQLLQMLG
jgi:flagellar hook-associated protein 1